MHLSIPCQWMCVHHHNKPIEIWFFLVSDLLDRLRGEVGESNEVSSLKKPVELFLSARSEVIDLLGVVNRSWAIPSYF